MHAGRSPLPEASPAGGCILWLHETDAPWPDLAQEPVGAGELEPTTGTTRTAEDVLNQQPDKKPIDAIRPTETAVDPNMVGSPREPGIC